MGVWSGCFWCVCHPMCVCVSRGRADSCSSVELLRAEQPTACLLGTVSAASCAAPVPGSQHLFAWLLCSAPFVLLFTMCLFVRTMCVFVRTCVYLGGLFCILCWAASARLCFQGTLHGCVDSSMLHAGSAAVCAADCSLHVCVIGLRSTAAGLFVSFS